MSPEAFTSTGRSFKGIYQDRKCLVIVHQDSSGLPGVTRSYQKFAGVPRISGLPLIFEVLINTTILCEDDRKVDLSHGSEAEKESVEATRRVEQLKNSRKEYT